MGTSAPSPHDRKPQFRLLRGLQDALAQTDRHINTSLTAPHPAHGCPPNQLPSESKIVPNQHKRSDAGSHQHLRGHIELRRELLAILRNTFDVIAGRRRISDLRKIATSSRIQSSVITHAKSGALKGVHLKSFHPNPAATSARIDFIGSCAIGPRTRAYTGTFTKTGGKRHAQWTLTAFKVI